MPTETVYGLAADATNAEAVARIYEAKGRPSFNPLIVHVPDLAAAERIGEFSEEALALAERALAGAADARRSAARAARTSPRSSPPAFRPSACACPAHPAMQALLRAAGRPLAAPSANASGSISPTRAEHVLKSLGGRIPLIIDGGPTERGIESTIVAATGGPLRLLRPRTDRGARPKPASGSTIEAPGQLASHYAPSKPLRLNATMRRTERISDRVRSYRRGREPQPLGRPRRSRVTAVRSAARGRRVGQSRGSRSRRCRTKVSAPRSTIACGERQRIATKKKGRTERRPFPCSRMRFARAFAGLQSG